MAAVVFILSLLTIFTSVGFLFAYMVHLLAKSPIKTEVESTEEMVL